MGQFKRAVGCITLLLGVCVIGLPLMAGEAGKKAEKKAADKKAAAKAEAAPAADRYKLPDGDDVAALSKFIVDLRTFRPSTPEEMAEYEKKFIDSLKQAAEKIVTLEKDKSSAAYASAKSLLLEIRLEQVQGANAEEQKKFLNEVKEFFAQKKSMDQSDFGLAFTIAAILESAGNKELALDAYNTFGKRFSESKEAEVAALGAKMLGSARRMDLMGKEMKLEGKTVDGKDFDWKAFRGKVVLIDFWATWCGPCVGELPNVKRNYELYKDKGFDVVGISLDNERADLEKFLKEQKVPWACLFEEGAGWNNTNANYYGIMAIPAVILVDKEGKVVHLEARGETLGAELARLLGPAEEKPATKPEEKTAEKAAEKGGEKAPEKAPE
jgi:thiol-disulfide isomerase/thioredoxin